MMGHIISGLIWLYVRWSGHLTDIICHKHVVVANSCKVPVYYLFERHFKANVNLKLSCLGGRI